jgi:phosphoribosyl 1,2-cyclic phosphodiesterase
MILRCLGSSSKGNCYILEGKTSKLILEAGVKFEDIRSTLDYKLENIAGCLITHEHKDHIKYINQMMLNGIGCYGSQGTFEGLEGQNIHCINRLEPFILGEFDIIPFDSVHDTREPFNFLIRNNVTKKRLLFLTDTAYCRYNFDNINYLLIEANHKADIMQKNVEEGIYPHFVAERVKYNHMELDTTIDFIRQQKDVESIVLLHLSEKNSDPMLFRSEVMKATPCKKVCIADKGVFAKL